MVNDVDRDVEAPPLKVEDHPTCADRPDGALSHEELKRGTICILYFSKLPQLRIQSI